MTSLRVFRTIENEEVSTEVSASELTARRLDVSTKLPAASSRRQTTRRLASLLFVVCVIAGLNMLGTQSKHPMTGKRKARRHAGPATNEQAVRTEKIERQEKAKTGKGRRKIVRPRKPAASASSLAVDGALRSNGTTSPTPDSLDKANLNESRQSPPVTLSSSNAVLGHSDGVYANLQDSLSSTAPPSSEAEDNSTTSAARQNSELQQKPAPRAGAPVDELDLLLQSRAVNGSIVLIVVNGLYSNMLQNCLCNLDALGVDSYIVGITDYPTYKGFRNKGYAVFYLDGNRTTSSHSNTLSREEKVDCSYNTRCFGDITKLKPIIVLRILEKGYSILFNDADVLWLTDVRVELLNYFSAAADLWVQSEIMPPGAANGYINSGFYSVRSNPHTIQAFREIIQHKTKVNHEQVSFNQVLCGIGRDAPEKLTTNTCVHNNVTTRMLDFGFFPNGKIFRHLSTHHKTSRRLPPQIKVVHNNYIKPLGRKIYRWKLGGYWFAGAGNETQCLEAARAKLLHPDFSRPEVKAVEKKWRETFG